MALTEQYLEEDIHPIDIVENLAAYHDWDFDRISDEQIAMAVEGQWRTYSITLAWSPFDETLRLVCTFEMDPPAEKLPVLYHLLNDVNDQCWTGAFTYWPEQKLMVYRYGLVLAGGQDASQRRREQRRAVLSRGATGGLGRPDAPTSPSGCHCRGVRPRIGVSPNVNLGVQI